LGIRGFFGSRQNQGGPPERRQELFPAISPIEKESVMNTKMYPLSFAARRRWMIVDNDEDVLMIMRHLLTRISDADVECFLSPQEALAAFAAAPETFELVITDLEMPRMDGIELGRKMRAISPAIKILLASGSGLLTEPEAVEKGFCGLLAKPFSQSLLSAALASALDDPAVKAPYKISNPTDGALQSAALTFA
jgi:CheY-like chemotaxis protein